MSNGTGMELMYDTNHTSTQNFYHSINEEWPEKDCSCLATEIIVCRIESILTRGNIVCLFFGLGRERITDLSNDETIRIKDELQMLRAKIKEEMRLLYCDKDDQGIVAYCKYFFEKNAVLEKQLRLLNGDESQSILERDISYLGMDVRTEQILLRYSGGRINTVGDLVSYNSRQLLKIKYFGPRCLSNVIEALDKHGLKLMS